MKPIRKIIHVDMDAFYASVEQRDNPSLKGKPVIISGPPQSRSVVCTCSYEARKYGVHSAMPSSHAYKLCPQGIFIPPQMEKYRQASSIIHSVFHEYTEIIEPLSLDEAFLDITEKANERGTATEIAYEIKRKIYERTGLTASAGVSFNKFLAKIASDFQKPDGLTVIRPDNYLPLLLDLPIKKFFGIGKKTLERIEPLGISTGRDLYNMPLFKLLEIFGKSGQFYYNIMRGIDDRPVKNDRTRKSMGHEITYSSDLIDMNQVLSNLELITKNLCQSLEDEGILGKTVVVKIKFSSFKQITRSYTHSHEIRSFQDVFSIVKRIMGKINLEDMPVRLLGVSLQNLNTESTLEDSKQMHLDFGNKHK